MILDGIFSSKKQLKRITPSERVLLREMIESDADNEEIYEAMPDLRGFYISNARKRAKKREAAKVSVPAVQPITELANQFKAIADLQKTMRESDKLLVDGIRAVIEAEQPADDDGYNDKIIDTFLEIMKQKTSTPAPINRPISPAGSDPKPIPPGGALKDSVPIGTLSDDQILEIVSEQVPKWVLKLIKTGKIKKKNAFAWLVTKRGVEADIFERAWRLIR